MSEQTNGPMTRDDLLDIAKRHRGVIARDSEQEFYEEGNDGDMPNWVLAAMTEACFRQSLIAMEHAKQMLQIAVQDFQNSIDIVTQIANDEKVEA